MVKFRRLAAADFRLTAVALQTVLADLSISLRPASDLAEMIDDLEWVASLQGEDVLFAAMQENPKRAARCLPRHEQARRMAAGLKWAKTQPAIYEKVRLLRKALDRLKTSKGPTLDFLFEVDIAYRASRAGLGVALSEPDVVLSGVLSGPVGLACKRPEGLQSLANAYRIARHQIATHAFPGIVVLGMENIIFDASNEGKPWKSAFYTVEAARDMRTIAAPYYRDAIQMLRKPISETPEANVAGIVLCACVTAMITKRPSAYGFAWVWAAIDREGTLASRVAGLLFGKSNRVSWALLANAPDRSP
jgi:hypothetical protein